MNIDVSKRLSGWLIGETFSSDEIKLQPETFDNFASAYSAALSLLGKREGIAGSGWFKHLNRAFVVSPDRMIHYPISECTATGSLA